MSQGPSNPKTWSTLGRSEPLLPQGELAPGQILFGRYKLTRQIGQGGMGCVWQALHLNLEQERALKLILPAYTYDELARKRFRREAVLTAKLNGHPNAVTVHDCDISPADAYIEMEYIHGRSVDRLLQGNTPMSVPQVTNLLTQMCAVLQEAHRNGIIHRDLKPSNLMIVDGRESENEVLKVLDFGIAKILGPVQDGLKTEPGDFLGTVPYASPEQFMDGPQGIDARSDLYSVGVLLYEFLTGFRPFQGKKFEQIHLKLTSKPPPFSIRNARANVPQAIEQVVLRCLSVHPDNRPQSPRELAAEFLEAVRSSHVSAPDPGTRAPNGTSWHHPAPIPIPDPETTSWASISEPEPLQGLITTETLVPTGDSRALPYRSPRFLVLLRMVCAVALVATIALVWFPRNKDEPVYRPPPPPPPRKDDPPPPPPPSTIRPDPRIVQALSGWKRRGYAPPDPDYKPIQVWPSILREESTDVRFKRSESGHYLPEGFEPSGARAADEWPSQLTRNDGVVFMRIPGGTFMMGSDNVKDARPPHLVKLSGFYMQETEVTNGEMLSFADTLGPAENTRLEGWRSYLKTLDPGKGIGGDYVRDPKTYPAFRIDYHMAEAFSHWKQGRLPTEAQWEYAARSGGLDIDFPWLWRKPIENSDGQLSNLDGNPSGYDTEPVKRFPDGDMTKQGIYDLGGNVREWCRDVWKPYPRAESAPVTDPWETPSDPGSPRVVRGGDFSSNPVEANVHFRKSRAPGMSNRALGSDPGFRLVIECPADPLPDPATPKQGRRDAAAVQ